MSQIHIVQSMTVAENANIVTVEKAVELSQAVGQRIHWRPESTQRGVRECAEVLSGPSA